MYADPPVRCVFLCSYKAPSPRAAVALREALVGTSFQPGHVVHAGASSYTVIHVIPDYRAARATRATQFFILVMTSPEQIVRPLRLGLPPQGDGLVCVHQSNRGDDLLSFVDESLALALLGAFQAYFRPGGRSRSKSKSRCVADGGGGLGNFLLLSDAGAGTVECAVAAAHRVAATSVCVNLGVLVARGAESADRELRRALQVALATHPSVFIVEDAEALQEEADDVSAASLQAAILKLLSGAMAALSSAGDDAVGAAAPRVFVVACCHCPARMEDAMRARTVCGALCAQFSQALRVPPPSTDQQRAAVRAALLAAAVAVGRTDIRAGERLDALVDDVLSGMVDKWSTGADDAGAGQWPLPLLALHIEARKRASLLMETHAQPADAPCPSADGELALPLKEVPPVAAGGIPLSLDLPGVFGHADVKAVLAEVLLWPRLPAAMALVRALSTSSDGTTAPAIALAESGVLLYGPPGTGKTLLPAACAAALRCPLLELKLTDVVRSEIGAGEKELTAAFGRAKLAAPCIVFIDEFQAIFTSRAGSDTGDRGVGSSLTSTLAACFDDLAVWNGGAGSSALVTVVAATNEPWAVDDGFLRPGRLGRALFVGPLGRDDRLAFIRAAVGGGRGEGNEDATESAEREAGDRTDGFTGADMSLLLRRATIAAAAAGATGAGLCWSDVVTTLRGGGAAASVDARDIAEYQRWKERVT